MTSEELEKLPVTFGLLTAARAIGIGKNQAYRQVKDGTFPVRILPSADGRYRVSKFDLMDYLRTPAARASA